jgi:Ni2+-binding GTPase involved in maturation of urease and hydrogenase
MWALSSTNTQIIRPDMASKFELKEKRRTVTKLSTAGVCHSDDSMIKSSSIEDTERDTKFQIIAFWKIEISQFEPTDS